MPQDYLRFLLESVDICQTDYSIHSKLELEFTLYSDVTHESPTFKLTKD